MLRENWTTSKLINLKKKKGGKKKEVLPIVDSEKEFPTQKIIMEYRREC